MAAGARMPHLESPFLFFLHGWSRPRGRCPERKRALLRVSRHWSAVGYGILHLLS